MVDFPDDDRREPITRDRANRIRDVAALFSMTERSVWRMIRDGKLKVEYLGPRCPRIFDSEIARYRASLRAPVT